MRIAVVNVQAPYIRGGAEYLADSLTLKLRERGHTVEPIAIPFRWWPPQQILSDMLACRLLDLSGGEPDLVIAHKFPAYLIPASPKKLWLLHQFRQVYELWGTDYQYLPDTIDAQRIRDTIIAADNKYLREADAIYTNSRIVARRLKEYNGIDANGVLHPPLLHPENFHEGESGDYFFYPSRVVRSKRQEVAIEAMRHVKSPFKLVIAGQPDTDAYGNHLQGLIDRYDLRGKVTMLGWISDEEKARLMADACAALYIPFDEDSYGYVTLEAFHSHKPVITFTDSGGTDEVIEHGVNGLMLEPTPEALAAGMEQLYTERQKTIEMGHNAHHSIDRYQIRWNYVLDNLLS